MVCFAQFEYVRKWDSIEQFLPVLAKAFSGQFLMMTRGDVTIKTKVESLQQTIETLKMLERYKGETVTFKTERIWDMYSFLNMLPTFQKFETLHVPEEVSTLANSLVEIFIQCNDAEDLGMECEIVVDFNNINLLLNEISKTLIIDHYYYDPEVLELFISIRDCGNFRVTTKSVDNYLHLILDLDDGVHSSQSVPPTMKKQFDDWKVKGGTNVNMFF